MPRAIKTGSTDVRDSTRKRVGKARNRLNELQNKGTPKHGANGSAPVVLTSSIPTPGADTSSGAGAGAGIDVVNAVIADRLGWRVRTNDPDGFKAALTGAYEAEQRPGYVVYNHVPRSFSTQADLGAVTGAQASLHARAAESVAGVRRAFEGLEPIFDENRSRAEAHRDIVLGRLDALVDELGRVGGPRTHIVDDVFETLVGPAPLTDPEDLEPGPGSQLALMRLEYSLTHEWVSTIQDEVRLTSFLTGVDAINALYSSWLFQRAYFDSDPIEQPYLGTQLVHVARALDVVIESVAETRAVLQANFIGDAEQLSLVIDFDGSPLTVSDVLEWADESARDGAQMIKRTGREGVVAMLFPLTTLCEAVEQFQPPVFSFPQLYNDNPLIASALHVLEVNLLRLVALIAPLERRPEGTPPASELPKSVFETDVGTVTPMETKSLGATIAVDAPAEDLKGLKFGLVPSELPTSGKLREATIESRKGSVTTFRVPLEKLAPGEYTWVARHGDETVPLFTTRITN